MRVSMMNFGTLIQRLQAYYGGRYGGEALEILDEEFGDFNQLYLGCVYAVTVRNYSTKWGKLPDVATINEFRHAIDELYEQVQESTPRIAEPPMSDEERAVVQEQLKELVDRLVGAKRWNP